MSGHDIIVIGASAGGVEALRQLVRDLPRRIPAAIFVVLHIPAHSPSSLPNILTRTGALPAAHPVDGVPIENGHIYIAPPDHHLLIEQGYMRVARSPKENRHRPAIDPLFRSAALAYGPRVVGVILTGALNDGTAGLMAIKQQGGLAIVQDPKEALYSGMPQSAVEHVSIDHCISLSRIAPLLQALAHEAISEEPSYPVSEDLEKEVTIADMETDPLNENEQFGKPSSFSCPECGGVLREVQDGTLLRYRCHTGHAYTAESVLAEQSENLEKALWIALRTLEEKVQLSRRLTQQAREHGREWLALSYGERLHETEHHAELLRQILSVSSDPD